MNTGVVSSVAIPVQTSQRRDLNLVLPGRNMIGALCGCRAFGSVVIVGCMAVSAQAAVVCRSTTSSSRAGTLAEVRVSATSNSGDVITGFNLPTDLNDNGYTAGVSVRFDHRERSRVVAGISVDHRGDSGQCWDGAHVGESVKAT